MIYWFTCSMRSGNWKKKAIITEEYKDISNNDMHIIEAIGLGKGNNMSAIAKKLNNYSWLSDNFYEQFGE